MQNQQTEQGEDDSQAEIDTAPAEGSKQYTVVDGHQPRVDHLIDTFQLVSSVAQCSSEELDVILRGVPHRLGLHTTHLVVNRSFFPSFPPPTLNEPMVSFQLV